MNDNDGLNRWLAITTDGLCEDAKARIADELDAHYRLAASEMRSEGMSDEEAKQRAVASLGNPKGAMRSFKHIYLTMQEAQLVERLSKPREARKLFVNAFWLFIMSLNFVRSPLIPYQKSWRSEVLAVIGFTVSLYLIMQIVYWLYKSGGPTRKIQVLLLFDLLLTVIFLSRCMVPLLSRDFVNFGAYALFSIIFLFYIPFICRLAGWDGWLLHTILVARLLGKLKRPSSPSGPVKGPLAQ